MTSIGSLCATFGVLGLTLAGFAVANASSVGMRKGHPAPPDRSESVDQRVPKDLLDQRGRQDPKAIKVLRVRRVKTARQALLDPRAQQVSVVLLGLKVHRGQKDLPASVDTRW